MANSEARSSDQTPEKPRRIRLTWAIAPLVIFIAIGAMFAVALFSGDPSRLPSALIGKPAPSLNMEPLAGLQRDGVPIPSFGRNDLTAGKVSIVNFWASWCGPCVQEHPLLVELAGRDGVQILGVNYKDAAPGGLNFLRRLGNPYTAVGTDPNGRNAIEWGVYGMPETFVVDGDGVIVYKHVGPITEQSLQGTLIPAIERAQSRKN
ncbi:MAG: DsbE family thiol:disulfide interchange protein [Hyphomicrobiaceae bacterium]